MTAFDGARVLLTGAPGGIGRELARRFVDGGARLVVAGRQSSRLDRLAGELGAVVPVTGDLGTAPGRKRVLEGALAELGAIDLLVNNAGALEMNGFEAMDPTSIERQVSVNLLAPMLLTRSVLPAMLDAGAGQIVNIGSALGAIGMPFHAPYCATKAGLQRFSEALGRELADTGVRVTYVAPRATRTELNSKTALAMHEATGTHVDDPGVVADQIIAAILGRERERFLGWPEKLFVRLNALAPGLVGSALVKQAGIMAKFARSSG